MPLQTLDRPAVRPAFDAARAVHVHERDRQPVIIATDEDFRQLAADKELGDYVGSTLARTYPGYRWRVEPHAHPTKPFVSVRCEHTNCKYGYNLQPWRFFDATTWKAAIIRAGGEILERNGLNRRALDVTEFLSRPRNRAGVWVPEGV